MCNPQLYAEETSQSGHSRNSGMSLPRILGGDSTNQKSFSPSPDKRADMSSRKPQSRTWIKTSKVIRLDLSGHEDLDSLDIVAAIESQAGSLTFFYRPTRTSLFFMTNSKSTSQPGMVVKMTDPDGSKINLASFDFSSLFGPTAGQNGLCVTATTKYSCTSTDDIASIGSTIDNQMGRIDISRIRHLTNGYSIDLNSAEDGAIMYMALTALCGSFTNVSFAALPVKTKTTPSSSVKQTYSGYQDEPSLPAAKPRGPAVSRYANIVLSIPEPITDASFGRPYKKTEQ